MNIGGLFTFLVFLAIIMPGYVIWSVLMSSVPTFRTYRQHVLGSKVILGSLFFGVLYQLLILLLLPVIGDHLQTGLSYANITDLSVADNNALIDFLRHLLGWVQLAFSFFYLVILPALFGAALGFLSRFSLLQPLLKWFGFAVDQNVNNAFQAIFSPEMKSNKLIVCLFRDGRIAIADYSSKDFVNAYNKPYDLLLAQALILNKVSDAKHNRFHTIWVSLDEVKSIHFFNDVEIAMEFCETSKGGSDVG